MSHINSLPLWAQWVWAAAGLLMLCLAICWTLFIFWPYLRRSERKHNYSIKLAEEGKADFIEMRKELTKALTKLAEAQAGLGTAQKVNIGVQVLTSLIPLFLNSVTAVREEPKKSRSRG